MSASQVEVIDLNKDYKIMAGLIPIILILSVVLYIFPDVTGINTNLAAPLLINQTNNTTSIVANNSTVPTNQDQSVNTQDSQSSSTDTSNNNNDQQSDTTDTSNTDTGTDNSTSTDTNTPTDTPTDTNTTS